MFDFNLPVTAIPSDYREFLPALATPAIDGLIHEYEEGESEMRRLHDYIMRAENHQALSSFAYGAQAYYQSALHARHWSMDLIEMFDLSRALHARQEHYWFRLFDMVGLSAILPADLWEQWSDTFVAWRQPGSKFGIPAFDHSTVYSCISMIEAHRANFFSMRVDSIWRALSGWHKTNWGGAFHNRFIIDWMFSDSGTPTSKDRSFIDLVNVCSSVMTGSEDPFYNTYGHLRQSREKHGEWHELLNGALRIKAFKRGTLHCEIHPDIANRLNIALAYLHPNALPDEVTLKRPRRKNGFGSSDLLNQKIPHQVRSYLSECAQTQTEEGFWLLKPHHFINKMRVSEAVKAIINAVLSQVGGTPVEDGHLFDYPPSEVVQSIIKLGEVPEKISHQYFATPADLADEFVSWARIEPTSICYETSAGTGAIAKFMPLQTRCIEVDRLRCIALECMGFEVTQGDFLEMSPEDIGGQADAVLMNPPFSERRWIDHIEHAASFVRPGGLVAAILPEGAVTRLKEMNGVAVEFSRPMTNRFPDASITVVFARWVKPEVTASGAACSGRQCVA